MTSQINDLGNVWSGFNRIAVKGPIRVSHKVHPQLQMHLEFFECAVRNKSRLSLPATFGVLPEIENAPPNSSQSQLQVWVAPKYSTAVVAGIVAPVINGTYINAGPDPNGNTVYSTDGLVHDSGTFTQIYYDTGTNKWCLMSMESDLVVGLWTSTTTGNSNPWGLVYDTVTGTGTPTITETTAYAFPTRQKEVKGYSKHICSATERISVQPYGTGAQADANIWKSEATQLDDAHEILKNIIINSTSTHEYFEWSPEGQQYLIVKEDIVYSPTSTATTWSGTYLRSYEHVHCNWWIRRDKYYQTVTEVITGYNKWICKATRTITFSASASIPASNIWKASSKELVSGVFTVNDYTVVTTKTDHTYSKWIPSMGQFMTVTESLVESPADTTPDFDTGTKLMTTYEHQHCAWWVKTVEDYSDLGEVSYKQAKSYYWPAVLESIELASVTGQYNDNGTVRDYVHHITADVRMKEAYSGLCEATITKTFETSGSAGTMVSPLMIGDAFAYQGIFFNLSVPECLHGALRIREMVGTYHPTLKAGQFRIKQYPATSQAVWPATVTVISYEPMGGGFIKTQTVYARPS